MKRMIMFIVIVSIVVGGTCCYSSLKTNANPLDYRDKLIRFHVIANSDSVEDQNLKLKVRDKIIAYLSPKLEESKSLKESEIIINKNIKEIEKIGQEEILTNNKNYSIVAKLDYSDFPTKKYSNIVLPAGNYKALKIIIGEGNGKNWWCVMFPPLCFVDINHGITDKKAEKNMKMVLTQQEYNNILVQNSGDIKLKSKIFELVDKFKENNIKVSLKNKQ